METINRLIGALLLTLFIPLTSNAQTSFPNGFNNLPQTHWLRGRDVLEVPYPARWAVWFDDFTKYTAADWVITTTEAGGGDATEALSDADLGSLLITNDANDDDNDFLQTVGELFTFESGKQTYFEARFQVSDATQSDFFIGLQVRDTTPLAVADGVFFQKDDGDALLDLHSLSGSADSASTGISTISAATNITVAFYYDGGTSITAAVDDTVVATLSNVTPASTELTISFGLQNGDGNARTMTIDYILVAKER